jgi:hypothetical protein
MSTWWRFLPISSNFWMVSIDLQWMNQSTQKHGRPQRRRSLGWWLAQSRWKPWRDDVFKVWATSEKVKLLCNIMYNYIILHFIVKDTLYIHSILCISICII